MGWSVGRRTMSVSMRSTYSVRRCTRVPSSTSRLLTGPRMSLSASIRFLFGPTCTEHFQSDSPDPRLVALPSALQSTQALTSQKPALLLFPEHSTAAKLRQARPPPLHFPQHFTAPKLSHNKSPPFRSTSHHFSSEQEVLGRCSNATEQEIPGRCYNVIAQSTTHLKGKTRRSWKPDAHGKK